MKAEKSINIKNIICLASIVAMILIGAINQLLGHGNIAVNQGIAGISTNYLSSILTGLATGLELVALIKLINKPVQTILFTLASQIILIVSDISQGYSLHESFSNTGVFEIYFSFIAVGMLIVLWRSYSKQAKKENKLLGLSSYIKFKREPLKVPMWAIFSIACLGLSLVLSSAYNVEVGLWSDKLPFRIYVGLTLFVPTLTTLAMYTASNLVYYLYGAMMLIRVIVMCEMLSNNELRWTTLVSCIIQIAVYVYCIYEYIAYLKRTNVTS